MKICGGRFGAILLVGAEFVSIGLLSVLMMMLAEIVISVDCDLGFYNIAVMSGAAWVPIRLISLMSSYPHKTKNNKRDQWRVESHQISSTQWRFLHDFAISISGFAMLWGLAFAVQLIFV